VFPNSQWAGGPGGSGRRWSWGLDRRRYRLTSTGAKAGARTGKATREGAIVVAVYMWLASSRGVIYYRIGVFVLAERDHMLT
jgi:hypothetical protein